MNLKICCLILILFVSHAAFSEERLGQGRLFFGSTQVSPSELNTDLTNQSMKTIDLNNQFGIEITFPVISNLNLGLRYSKKIISQTENPDSSSTDYQTEINQDAAAIVARGVFYKSEYVRLDGVLGVGGSNTKYKIKTATQDGELEKKGTPFATPYALGGVSLGLGKGNFFFVIEAGYESQKVKDFSSSGTVNGNVTNIDLSGTYFAIGLMFDGIPVFMK